MIKSIGLLTLILAASFSSFGQTEMTVPPIELQYRVPVIMNTPGSCCATIVRKEKKSDEVLDITDPEISLIGASPNPTRGRLTVSVPANLIGYEIQVYDMTGRFAGSPIPITGTTQNLTLEGESGVYLIVIRTEKEIIKERVLLDTH